MCSNTCIIGRRTNTVIVVLISAAWLKDLIDNSHCIERWCQNNNVPIAKHHALMRVQAVWCSIQDVQPLGQGHFKEHTADKSPHHMPLTRNNIPALIQEVIQSLLKQIPTYSHNDPPRENTPHQLTQTNATVKVLLCLLHLQALSPIIH